MDGNPLPLGDRDEFERYCRAQVSAVYVGNRTLLCRVMGKYLCYVDSDDGAVAAHLAMDGFWETWNSLAIARHVGRGWRVVDVGANHGYFTLLLAELVGRDGRVFAIEPNPRLFELLQRTISLNGFDDRVTLLPYAAGEVDADAELRVPRGFSGDGSLRLDGDRDAAASPVRQRRIDMMIDGPIDFLKIDAEGADYAALAGAAGVLPRHRAVDVMLEHYAPFHECPRELLSRVTADGFSLRHVSHDGELTGTTFDDLEQQPSRLWDLWLSRHPEE